MEAGGAAGGRLSEAAALWWRERPSERSLRRDGRRWTVWTSAIVVAFAVPGGLLLYLSPWTAPIAAASFAHAWIITGLYARRGARSVVAIGSDPTASERPADGVALGLLADLVGHEARELLARTGLALHRGELGVWVIGEQGAMMMRPGGRRVDCWCVRVADGRALPAGDRVAHLLLALREDEPGFATVANMAFSGAPWRVRRKLPGRARPALDAACAVARDGVSSH